jgi:polysaccharide chain length determinant protein (PEP-CTERM system associated)
VIPGKKYTPVDIAAILWRRKWILLIPTLVIGLATYLVVRTMPNRYKSETLILVVPQRVPESYVKSTVTSNIADRLQTISQQILSRTRLERIVQDFDLYAKERRTAVMEDVVDKMRQDIEVLVIKGDSFRISYRGDEPRTAMQVTQRLASLFIDENLRDREMLAQGSYQFLESQLEDARRRLIEHEKKLEEYRHRYSGELPTQFQSNLQVIQNTQLQIQALNESIARDRDRRLLVERSVADLSAPDATPPPPLPPTGPSGDSAGGPPAGGTFAQQLEVAQQTLHQLELRLKPEHPDVIRMKRLVATLQQKAAADASRVAAADGTVPVVTSPAELAKQNRLREMKTELQSIDLQISRREDEEKKLRAIVAAYQSRIEATPARESELTELMRDYDTLQKTYTTLLTKKEDSKVAADLERNQIGEQFKVLDVARMPEKPDSPDRVKLTTFGLVGGLVLGLGLMALLELSDATLKSDDDVTAALRLPVLATVPLIESSTPARRRAWWLLAFGSAATAIGLTIAMMMWKFNLLALIRF